MTWGAALLFSAIVVLGIAIFIGGPRAMLPVVFSGATFTSLWVLARLKIFSQRNGVFFSLAVIMLIAALAALVEQGWLRLAGSGGGEPRVATNVPTQRAFSASLPTELPLLVQSLGLEPPDSALPRVRALRDFTTAIGDKTYRVQRGDVFLFADQKGGEVTLGAGEFLARVPANAVEVLAPSPTHTASAPLTDKGKSALERQADAKATQRAQEEAARRFPGLGRAGSPENRAFLEAYTELKDRKSDLLDDPEWPLELAQTLAQRLGWKESGVDEDTPKTLEPSMAPGTRVLAPADEPKLPATDDPDIPPPPRIPSGRN